jgi:hypothetical protein
VSAENATAIADNSEILSENCCYFYVKCPNMYSTISLPPLQSITIHAQAAAATSPAATDRGSSAGTMMCPATKFGGICRTDFVYTLKIAKGMHKLCFLSSSWFKRQLQPQQEQLLAGLGKH